MNSTLDSPAPRRIADAVRSKIEKFRVHLFVLGKLSIRHLLLIFFYSSIFSTSMFYAT
jgi:hypothetical protein